MSVLGDEKGGDEKRVGNGKARSEEPEELAVAKDARVLRCRGDIVGDITLSNDGPIDEEPGAWEAGDEEAEAHDPERPGETPSSDEFLNNDGKRGTSESTPGRGESDGHAPFLDKPLGG